ncbi:MAG TPA: DUF1778 domain-containing protein [Bryobacteraceae bacterium]|nr:DUF1778 domain-containing protein [Bryobacteraceae bacterium]
MSEQGNRTSRIEARIAPEVLSIVRRAAEIQGRSVSDFVVSAAQEAAQKTVSDMEILRLSREAQKQFAALLLNPPKPKAALTRAFKRRRSLIAD